MYCAQCGTLNGPTLPLCSGCGIDVRREPAPRTGDGRRQQSLLGGLDNPRETREALRELYAAAVGPKNRDHYLARFALFDHERKTSAGWHWPAFFVTFYWLVYRKMWGKAALYFFLPFMLLVPAALLGPKVPGVLVVCYLVYVVGIFIVPPLLADAAYYRHCESVIEKARAVNRSQEGQLFLVAQKGGTSRFGSVIGCLLVIALLMGLLAAVAWPAYEGHVARIKSKQALHFDRSSTDWTSRLG